MRKDYCSWCGKTVKEIKHGISMKKVKDRKVCSLCMPKHIMAYDLRKGSVE
jgi:predicted Fe-S protein YdhL (DUF1289 family)